MRAAAMFLFSLFLSGCLSGNSVLDEAVAFRQTLLNSNGCQFAAELTADYGDFVYTFSVECEAGQNGDMTFCVTSPETIAGITGKLSGTGGKLTFDDHLLQFDMLAEGLISPVSSPWVLVNTLRGGYIRSAGHDGTQYRLTIDDSYQDNAMQLDIWMEENMTPVRCEIVQEGRRIVSMHIRNFRLL